jgi:hypothetical protein
MSFWQQYLIVILNFVYSLIIELNPKINLPKLAGLSGFYAFTCKVYDHMLY